MSCMGRVLAIRLVMLWFLLAPTDLLQVLSNKRYLQIKEGELAWAATELVDESTCQVASKD